MTIYWWKISLQRRMHFVSECVYENENPQVIYRRTHRISCETMLIDGNINIELQYQHHGAPFHNIPTVWQWLDNVFLHKWIGRRLIAWLGRSTDLSTFLDKVT